MGGEHVGWRPGLAALLRALKHSSSDAPSSRHNHPALLAMHGLRGVASMNGPTVDQVFALLREWTTLQKVLIQSFTRCHFTERVMNRTVDFSSDVRARQWYMRAGKDVQLGRGSFVGSQSNSTLVKTTMINTFPVSLCWTSRT